VAVASKHWGKIWVERRNFGHVGMPFIGCGERWARGRAHESVTAAGLNLGSLPCGAQVSLNHAGLVK
jgi:hypothetical protein